MFKLVAMKKIFIIICLSIISAFSIAQSDYSGIWQGAIENGKSKILIVFRISEEESKLKASIDIPEQMVLDYKNIKANVKDDSLIINLAAFKASYKAIRINDSLEGIWYQSGMELPLNMELTPEDKAFSVKRPQTPEPPFPYICKEVTFYNKKAKIKLAGTLTIPDTTKQWPVVVLVSGSGPQDRNEEIAKHKPFLVIADYFTRNGIAVLRYDDRGVGKSEGVFGNATTIYFCNDAEAAVSFLAKLPYIDKNSIGIVGHSEGGIIALMQASKNKSLRFVISMAGVSIPCLQLLVMQNDKIMEGMGVEEDVRDFFWNYYTAFYNLLLVEKSSDSLKNKAIRLFDESIKVLSDEQQTEYHLNHNFVTSLLMEASSPWFKYFISIIPSNYISKIKINVLAINGAKDVQVPAEANIEAFNTYINPQRGIYKESHIFPGLNHLFQPCNTGMTSEYAMIETTIDPHVLYYMTEWIKKVTSVPKK